MDFTKTPLGELVKIIGGGTPSKKIPEYWNGEIPWATVKDLKDFSLNSTIDRITELGVKNSSTNIIPAGTVITATRIGLGKVALNTIDLAINQDLKALIPQKNLEPEYLFFFLASKANHFESIGKGATVKGITLDDLKNLQIPLPPLPEQRRLAALLDKADALRRKDRELLDKYDELVRGVFLEMFGDNGDHGKKSKLSEVADVVSGVTKGKKYNDQKLFEVPYMRVANVQDGFLDLSEIKTIEVPKIEIEKYLLRDGDVLLTEGGDPDKLGRGAVWQNQIENCIHQNHIYRVRVNRDVLVPQYLSAHVGSRYGKIYFLRAAKQTTGIATINSTQLKNFPVVVPDIERQQKYARIAYNIESQKAVVQRQAERSEALFQALLQGAFRGEV